MTGLSLLLTSKPGPNLEAQSRPTNSSKTRYSNLRCSANNISCCLCLSCLNYVYSLSLVTLHATINPASPHTYSLPGYVSSPICRGYTCSRTYFSSFSLFLFFLRCVSRPHHPYPSPLLITSTPLHPTTITIVNFSSSIRAFPTLL